VWLGLDADGHTSISFRPLEDGTLSDADDTEVDLDGVAAVRIAHRALIDEAVRDAWVNHLSDYEVQPLFEQFDRPLLTSKGQDSDAREIDDRRGWMIESFTLRGIAAKLGYQRGQAEDGGVFMEYVKRFEAADIVVLVEFTGSPLPEENIACALLALKFHRIQGGGYGWGSAVALDDVPPVLLSEAWNDYRRMAEAGPGFDADWEKKAEYW